MEKVNKKMGLGMVIVSLFFLFNPNLNLVDMLPDFIGYALLCRGLTYMGDLCEACERALMLFRRMILVDLLKWAALFWIFGISFSDEQNTLLLLMSFVFGLVELIFLIPAYRALFDGILRLGYKYDNTSVMGKRSESSKKNYTEKIKSVTFVFVALKILMYVLPEFSVLGSQNYDESMSVGTVNIYNFIGLVRSMAFIVALIFGIAWLIRAFRYFRRVAEDKPFIAALKDEYITAVLPKTSMFLQRTVKSSFFVLMIFAVLCIDLRADSFNFIPDFAAAAALVVMALMMRRYSSASRKYLPWFAVYGGLCIVSTVIEIMFFERYYYGAVVRNEKAMVLYCVMLAAATLEAAAFMLSSYGVIRIMKEIIDGHTGFVVPEAKGVIAETAQERIEKLHRELYKKLYLVGGAALLMTASDLFYDFGARKFGFVGIINTVCTLIFIVIVYSATSAIFEEVQSKYMLD